jgi:hypothetical protein
MKESYGERLATHTGPKSCGVTRESGGEALTGERAGRVLSRERTQLQGADAVGGCGRLHPGHRQREMARSPARSETPCTHGHTSRENRELLSPPRADGAVGRVGKSPDLRRR